MAQLLHDTSKTDERNTVLKQIVLLKVVGQAILLVKCCRAGWLKVIAGNRTERRAFGSD